MYMFVKKYLKPTPVLYNVNQANKMAIDTKSADPNVFTLIDKSHGSDLKLICQASNEETKQNWVTQIGSMLNMQGDFMRGKLNMVYSKCSAVHYCCDVWNSSYNKVVWV